MTVSCSIQLSFSVVLSPADISCITSWVQYETAFSSWVRHLKATLCVLQHAVNVHHWTISRPFHFSPFVMTLLFSVWITKCCETWLTLVTNEYNSLTFLSLNLGMCILQKDEASVSSGIHCFVLVCSSKTLELKYIVFFFVIVSLEAYQGYGFLLCQVCAMWWCYKSYIYMAN
jgi:hypothetical protein